MVGGLIVSQVLTLYTTPVIYLFFDRLQRRYRRWRGLPEPGSEQRQPGPDELPKIPEEPTAEAPPPVGGASRA